MTTSNFDPRWIFVIFIVFLFVARNNPYVTVVILAIGAGWALQAGLSIWRDVPGPVGGAKVIYWRGQRIETPQPAWSRIRSISPLQIATSVLYLVLGLGAAYAALVSFLRLSDIVR